ncbi:unnamed protein product [Cylicostephanus goldi]|uniref:Uncharacterized protein n=1 Tax=Cylicostephanus goldi TaxID=71465 RepID=A0A3P7MHZ8_CYLGO|nr:unnamed protein product [Cylicostephanus goldi]
MWHLKFRAEGAQIISVEKLLVAVEVRWPVEVLGSHAKKMDDR